MDGYFLSRYKAFTLVETTLVLAILFLLLSVIGVNAWGRYQAAKGERTVKDLEAIAQAGVLYHSRIGAWPAVLGDLQPEFLSAGVGNNIFGNPFILSSSANMLTVSTLVDSGALVQGNLGAEITIVNQGNNDLVSLAKPAHVGVSGRLKYDKKRLYLQ